MVESPTAESNQNTDGTAAIDDRSIEVEEIADEEETVAEASRHKKDYAPPKKVATIKRQLKQRTPPQNAKRSRKKNEVAMRNTAAVALPVTNRGDVEAASVLGVDEECVPFPQYRRPGDINN